MNTVLKYIGTKDMLPDGVYGTGKWEKGQTKPVPAGIAVRMLRHVGVWELAEGEDLEAVQMEAAIIKPEPDTEIQEIEADLLRKQVSTMEKQQLIDMATKHFGVKLAKNLSLEHARTKVSAMIDQYGVA